MNIINNRLRLPLGNFAQVVTWGSVQNPITITLSKDCCTEEKIEVNHVEIVELLGEEYTAENMFYVDLKSMFENNSVARMGRAEIVNLETGNIQFFSLDTPITNYQDYVDYWNNTQNVVKNAEYNTIFPGNKIILIEDEGLLYFQLPYPFVLKTFSIMNTSYTDIKKSAIPVASSTNGIYFTEQYLYVDSSLIGLDKFEDGVWKLDMDYKYENFDTVFTISDSVFIDNTINCFISDIIINSGMSKEDLQDVVIAYSTLKILSSCPTKDFKVMCNILKGLYKVLSKPSNNLKNRSCNEC